MEAKAIYTDYLSTRAKIIAVAEQLFSEKGIDGVSLREISQSAGQKNKSAAQYHFGDKRGLILAIWEKHVPRIEEQRMNMLQMLEQDGSFEMMDIVKAVVLPIAEKLNDPDGGIYYLQVMSQLVSHPDMPLLDLYRENPGLGTKRVMELLEKYSPNLPLPLRFSRMLLISGMIFHSLSDYCRLSKTPLAAQFGINQEIVVQNLLATIKAIITAPIES